MSSVHEHNLKPASFLMENFELLPMGRVLDVAMGFGRNAVFLAEMGFEVEGVDISPEAVENALKLARDSGVTIQAETANLEGDYHIKRDHYDVIICFNYLQRSLIPQIKEGLRPGGMIVCETFIVDQAQMGHPKNPDFLLQHNELLEMFHDFRCLRYREGITEGKAVAGIVAQKNAL